MYQSLISINADIRFGKPCVINTRIAVSDVLSWLATGMTQQEITEDFPEITVQHIQACLAYSADRERKIRVAI